MTTESQNRYVAALASDEFETARLELLEALGDPVSRRYLDDTGLAPGWHCLEVGAGRGSIMRYLADQVGPGGCVVAADMNPRFLWQHQGGNIEVREHNVLEQDFESGRFDLVHCRAVLMHLDRPELALSRMAAALKPGGVMLVEEGDFFSFQAVDESHPQAGLFNSVTAALCRAMQAIGHADPLFGRHVRCLLAELGFDDIQSRGSTGLAQGGDNEGRFWHMTYSLPGSLRLVETGLVSAEDFETVKALFLDPGFEFIASTMFAASGRKPG